MMMQFRVSISSYSGMHDIFDEFLIRKTSSSDLLALSEIIND